MDNNLYWTAEGSTAEVKEYIVLREQKPETTYNQIWLLKKNGNNENDYSLVSLSSDSGFRAVEYKANNEPYYLRKYESENSNQRLFISGTQYPQFIRSGTDNTQFALPEGKHVDGAKIFPKIESPNNANVWNIIPLEP